jgi:uncharacterized protein (TIGR02594 family)
VQVVDLLGESNVWAHVQAGKRIGWMAKKYLTPEDHQAAPPSAEEECPWMPVALGELGVRESTEPGQSNPRIVLYLLSTDLGHEQAHDDSTPWCSAFINWCVERSGHAGTNSAAARSWLDWGRPISIPRRGVLAVFKRGQSGGHVGAFIRRDTERIWVLGGNQTNEVSIAGYAPDRLLGYRLPTR